MALGSVPAEISLQEFCCKEQGDLGWEFGLVLGWFGAGLSWFWSDFTGWAWSWQVVGHIHLCCFGSPSLGQMSRC